MVQAGTSSKSMGKNRPQPDRSPKDRQKRSVVSSITKQFSGGPMMVLLMFSTALIILAPGTFFFIYYHIVRSTTIAAMGALVVVQIILAGFIYYAWRDETRDYEREQKEAKKD